MRVAGHRVTVQRVEEGGIHAWLIRLPLRASAACTSRERNRFARGKFHAITIGGIALRIVDIPFFSTRGSRDSDVVLED